MTMPTRRWRSASCAERGFAAADLPDRRARADVVRAHSLLRAGRVDEARALFDATLVRARELQLLPVQVRCLTGQGLAARAAGDPEGGAGGVSSGRRIVRGNAAHAARRRDSQRVPDRPPAALPGAAAHGARRPRAVPVRLRSPPRYCGNSTAFARVRWASGSRAARSTEAARILKTARTRQACGPGSTGSIGASAACRTTPCRRPR